MLRAYAKGALFGESFGPEPARLLALHGWAHDHHDFDQLLGKRLEGAISSIALDLPGFGASPAPESAWGSDDYAAFVVGVLEEMASRPILLGHSFGGRVALQIAATYPDRVGGLVLSGVPLVTTQTTSSPPLAYRVVRALSQRGLLSDARLERARQRYGSADYRAAHGVMREVLVRTVNERYEQIIPKIKAPVEMVWGETDSAAPIGEAEHARNLFPNASLIVVKGVGHMTPTDAVDDLAKAIERLVT